MDVTLYKHIPHSLTCNEKFDKKKKREMSYAPQNKGYLKAQRNEQVWVAV